MAYTVFPNSIGKFAGPYLSNPFLLSKPQPSFAVNFDDNGSGIANLVVFRGAATPTYTRASVKWTKLSSGLWAQVASGSPCSLYSGFDTAAGTYLGYYAEGAATQLVTPTDSIRDMTNAAWTAGATMTVAKDGVGIDGAANSCSRLTGGGVAATNTILQTLTAAASSRTYSVWLQRVTGTGVVNITQDGGSTWTAVTSSLTTANFVRVSLTASVLNAAFGVQVETDGDVVLADFNQFEAGAFATSPLAAAGAARNADVLTYPTTGWLNAASGTVYNEFQIQGQVAGTVSNYVLSLDNGTSDERINLGIHSSLRSYSVVVDDAVVVAELLPPNAGALNQTYRQAFAYAANDFVMTDSNGGAVATDSAGGIPDITTLRVGLFSGGGTETYGPIRRVAYYPRRLSNGQLQNLTT